MTYGSPTNLDLSACTVSPDGGKTSQTLAAVATAVEGNATAVSKAQEDATDAKKAAQDAVSAISDLNLNNTYVRKDAIGQANGVVGTDPNGNTNIPALTNGSAVVNFGTQDSPIASYNQNYNFENNIRNTYISPGTNDAGAAGYVLYTNLNSMCPTSPGQSSLGMAKMPWSAVYSQTAVVVTSDANFKTIAGKLNDTSYADGQKLVAALATVQPVVYQLNSSISEKGADKARLHIGYLAQEIEAAITKVGLDPERFGLWTKTALTVPAYQNNNVEKPLLDANGNQKYIQMLRYEEVFPVVLAGISGSISELATRVAALEAKAGA